ncbi:RES family NAD+ phosphorylase [Agrococcus citreus]|uniref:RES domain-containing protein n=1 Tax=Agrococcus citreus TaxID=84643 RepID=A0ABN1YW73_9MICO
MRVFRIFSYREDAAVGEPGHPAFIDRMHQGSGRWDNPASYATGYFSQTAEGAVSEVYGGFAVWRPVLFTDDPRDRRLGAFELPDSLRLADFDDPRVLSDFDVRVSEVTARDPRRTQAIAAAVHDADFDGISWGSHYHPSLMNLAVFEPAEHGLRCTAIEKLDIDHAAVSAAAGLIVRHIDRRPPA